MKIVDSTMIYSRNILLSLLKNDYDEYNYSKLSYSIWKNVIKIAAQQGVYALAYDAMLNLPKRMRPQTDLLINWALNVERIEKRYLKQLSVFNKLSKSLEEHGLKCILLKGFSISCHYPVPFHREFGDIDIFSGNNFHTVNDIIISMGGNVAEDYYRHAHCILDGIVIENHVIMSDVRVQKDDLKLEIELTKEVERLFNSSCTPGVLYPSANFNALFLSWHAASHFMFESIQLRHVYDWKIFLEKELMDVDIEWFFSVKSKLSYGKFADILTALAIDILGLDESVLPKQIRESVHKLDKDLVSRVIGYIFESKRNERNKSLWAHRLDLIVRALNDRWKYREIYDMSVFKMFWLRSKGIFMK